MKDSVILRQAWDLIGNESTLLIDAALYRAHAPRHQIEKLRGWIVTMLGGKSIPFEVWLYRHGVKEVWLYNNKRAVKYHKMLWLDYLIRICESEGE